MLWREQQSECVCAFRKLLNISMHVEIGFLSIPFDQRDVTLQSSSINHELVSLSTMRLTFESKHSPVCDERVYAFARAAEEQKRILNKIT